MCTIFSYIPIYNAKSNQKNLNLSVFPFFCPIYLSIYLYISLSYLSSSVLILLFYLFLPIFLLSIFYGSRVLSLLFLFFSFLGSLLWSVFSSFFSWSLSKLIYNWTCLLIYSSLGLYYRRIWNSPKYCIIIIQSGISLSFPVWQSGIPLSIPRFYTITKQSLLNLESSVVLASYPIYWQILFIAL